MSILLPLLVLFISVPVHGTKPKVPGWDLDYNAWKAIPTFKATGHLIDWYKERTANASPVSPGDKRFGQGVLATALTNLQNADHGDIASSKHYKYDGEINTRRHQYLYFAACKPKYLGEKPNKLQMAVSMAFLVRGQKTLKNRAQFSNALKSTILYTRYCQDKNDMGPTDPTILVLPILERSFEMIDALGMGAGMKALYNDQLTDKTLLLGQELSRNVRAVRANPSANGTVQPQPSASQASPTRAAAASITTQAVATAQPQAPVSTAPATPTRVAASSQVTGAPAQAQPAAPINPATVPGALNINKAAPTVKTTGPSSGTKTTMPWISKKLLLLVGIGAIVLLTIFYK